ncbi:MAG: hypothetical protein ACI4V7_11995 [Succinivibrionaceae bacterium]
MKNVIEQLITENIGTVYSQNQETIDTIEAAVGILSLAVSENKIICMGSTECEYLCNMFSSMINTHSVTTTGSLRSIHLTTNNIEHNFLPINDEKYFSLLMQLELLYKEGDILLLISNKEENNITQQIIDYAHQLSIPFVLITNSDNTTIKECIHDEDIPIYIKSENIHSFMIVSHLVLTIIISLINEDVSIDY